MSNKSLIGYRLVLSKQVEKDLSKISKDQVALIKKRLETLTSDMSVLDIKKMIGRYSYPTYRLRSGDYRVIYQVQKQEIIILIIKIAHRREVYRNRGSYE